MIRLLRDGKSFADTEGKDYKYLSLSEALTTAYYLSLILDYAEIQLAEENSFRGGLDILATVTCNRIERIKG